MTCNSEIHILVSLDEKYLLPLEVMLTSLFQNNPGEQFVIHLVHSRIPAHRLEALGQGVAGAGHHLVPLVVDAELFGSAPTQDRFPQEMYYRLLAADILPAELDRVLYLDPDILVINPVRPLWDMDLQGRIYAAAAHTGKTEFANEVNRLRLGTDHNYYNSGVLLISLDTARQQVRAESIFAYIHDHEAQLLLPDQDILNGLYGSQVLAVEDAVWNYDARNYSSYLLRSGGDINENWILENTSILHFCGREKPWLSGYRYRFRVLYRHYMQLSRRMFAGAKST